MTASWANAMLDRLASRGEHICARPPRITSVTGRMTSESWVLPSGAWSSLLPARMGLGAALVAC